MIERALNLVGRGKQVRPDLLEISLGWHASVGGEIGSAAEVHLYQYG